MNKLIKQAFTLIELLVVIAIIGILSGLIIVGMSSMTQKATIAKAQVFSNSLRNSLMLNIVGEYKFDGTATDGTTATNADVLDTWGGVNNGSVTVPVRSHVPTVRTGSKCVSGSCLEFNGSADYVVLGSGASLNPSSAITLSAWVKPNDITIYPWFIATYRTESYALRGFLGRVGFGIRTSSGISEIGTTDNPLVVGNWIHIVETYDSAGGADNQKIYINGNLNNKTSYTGTLSPIIYMPVYIGNNTENANYVNGLIDDVRIYNAAMPTSQIKEQYYAGLNKLLANGGITREEYQGRVGELAVGL